MYLLDKSKILSSSSSGKLSTPSMLKLFSDSKSSSSKVSSSGSPFLNKINFYLTFKASH